MATYTNLNNEIFARNAIQGLCSILFPLSKLAHNFSPDSGQKGDQVLVPLISTLTATTFSAYNICNGTKTVATINLNKHKHIAVGQRDITYHSSSESDLKSFSYQMGKALGTLVLTDILSLVTTANFTAAGTTTLASFDVYQMRAARLALNKANAPIMPRTTFLDCDPYDVLLGITNFVQAQMFADNQVLKEGRIGRALGTDLIEINNLFASGASVMAFMAHPDAIAVAMRYVEPQAGNKYSNLQRIEDPETGLVIGLREHYDENVGEAYINLECLYGYTVGLTNCGRILKRAD